jgi:hypothetical protein
MVCEKDRVNIDRKELAAHSKLSSAYVSFARDQLGRLCENGDLQELCNDDKAQIKK